MNTATATTAERPVPALPSVSATRYRFRDLGDADWRTAGDTGIESGPAAACGIDVLTLDFDTAIELAHRYLEEADLAESRGDEAAEYQWSRWAEVLEIYAARRRSAPGRVIVNRVHHDDQAVSFAMLTRRG